MSIYIDFIDILGRPVRRIDTFVFHVDISSDFRQVWSIGRLHRHLGDAVAESPDWPLMAYCL